MGVWLATHCALGQDLLLLGVEQLMDELLLQVGLLTDSLDSSATLGDYKRVLDGFLYQPDIRQPPQGVWWV